MQSFNPYAMSNPIHYVWQLPTDIFKIILDIITSSEAEHMPGWLAQPFLLDLCTTCKAMRQAMLPLIGSTRLLPDWAPTGPDVFVQDVRAQLSRFPRAAVLRVLRLDLDIGPWSDVTRALEDEGIKERLKAVVHLEVVIKQKQPLPIGAATWPNFCEAVRGAFPNLRKLFMEMVDPPIFVIRELKSLVSTLLYRCTQSRVPMTVPAWVHGAPVLGAWVPVYIILCSQEQGTWPLPASGLQVHDSMHC